MGGVRDVCLTLSSFEVADGDSLLWVLMGHWCGPGLWEPSQLGKPLSLLLPPTLTANPLYHVSYASLKRLYCTSPTEMN